MPRRAIGLERGFLAVTLVLAGLLTATATSSFLGARRLTEVLVHGEGESLWHRLREALPRGRPPTAPELAAALDPLVPEGLRYVALVRGETGEVLAAAGEAAPTGGLSPDPRVRLGPDGIARLRRPLGPPPDLHGPPPGRSPELGELKRDRSLPPELRAGLHATLEFEPQLGAALRERARRDLVVSLAVAAALLVSAAIFHRLQRRARLAEAGLVERRHLAALGEMSAVLAHEIRNPLASLKGHAQLLEEQLADDGRRRAKARRIVDEAVRLERLTTSLLDFVRAGQIALAVADPRALARRAVDVTDPARVVLDLSAAPAAWTLDAMRVEQVLVNLLRNALEVGAADAAIELRVGVEDGGLVFAVADRGPGIPDDLRARLFDPFVTGSTHGTGLGLAVVRRVVELHGGHVAAHPREGGGSVFRVWLPAGAGEVG